MDLDVKLFTKHHHIGIVYLTLSLMFTTGLLPRCPILVQFCNLYPSPSAMFLDDFEPLYEISSTEMSQVYAAKRYDTQKEVIVKVRRETCFALVWKVQ